MAANTVSLNASLNLTELDFHGLKQSFKNYLKTQDVFKDYDFDGSSLNVLMELLAFNTFKNAFFSNMIHSEGFIDSAQLRSSLFSHSKELNYLPRSKRSSKARVRISFQASGESQPYIVPKGAQMSTLIKSNAYTFSVPETLTVASADTNFEFETDIYEGVYIKDSYVFGEATNQRFKITNRNVDTSSISVIVYEDGSTIGDIYKMTTTLLDLTEASKVFFLQTSETGHYEIYFGDNVLGRQPKLNSTVVIDYRISSGLAGNGARVFSVDFDPTGNVELLNTPSVEVIEASQNAAEEEDNESIRYYAPRSFQVQERAVTKTDYEIILKQAFPEINSVAVYGGEETNPPRFGKVFVAVDISNVDGLPENKKTEYFNFLKRRSPMSIDPIIVEPEITYLSIDSLVRYNLNVTTNSINRIKTLVTSAIVNYNTTYLNDFNTTLRRSQLSSAIDDCDISIISNITEARMMKKINPAIGIPQNIIIDFKVPLMNNLPPQQNQYSAEDQRTISSSIFRYNGEVCTLEDNGDGRIWIVKFSDIEHVKITDVGSVDYARGTISLVSFNIENYDGNALKVYAEPEDKDIATSQNVMLMLEPDEITIDVEALRI